MKPNNRIFTAEECATLPFEGLSPNDAVTLLFAIQEMAQKKPAEEKVSVLFFPSQEVDALRAKVRERFDIVKDWSLQDLFNANLPKND